MDLGPEIGGTQKSEDLFVYTLKHITLKRGQRMVVPVTEFTIKYSDIYTLDIAATPPAEIWRQISQGRPNEMTALMAKPKAMHKLRLTNDSKYPLTTAPARRLAVQPVIVPILRAGLGFVHAAQELMPNADVGFIGISRDEETFQPHPYVNKLPESLSGRPVIVIDPMLATGGSLVHTVALLTTRNAPVPITVVCALAAPEGIQRLRDEGLDLHVITAAIDNELNEHAFIVPGLGDAGDRQFGSGG
jgi:uracil phosphoribosyltransferase